MQYFLAIPPFIRKINGRVENPEPDTRKLPAKYSLTLANVIALLVHYVKLKLFVPSVDVDYDAKLQQLDKIKIFAAIEISQSTFMMKDIISKYRIRILS